MLTITFHHGNFGINGIADKLLYQRATHRCHHNDTQRGSNFFTLKANLLHINRHFKIITGLFIYYLFIAFFLEKSCWFPESFTLPIEKKTRNSFYYYFFLPLSQRNNV